MPFLRNADYLRRLCGGRLRKRALFLSIAVPIFPASQASRWHPADSKSPSTRDGQPLELWYYAFD